jgi:hypothetical protein
LSSRSRVDFAGTKRHEGSLPLEHACERLRSSDWRLPTLTDAILRLPEFSRPLPQSFLPGWTATLLEQSSATVRRRR